MFKNLINVSNETQQKNKQNKIIGDLQMKIDHCFIGIIKKNINPRNLNLLEHE